MSKIFVDHPRTGTREEIDFAALVSIIKGTSIVSLADSDRFIEVGLSENLLLHIESVERAPYVSVLSTLNTISKNCWVRMNDCILRRPAKGAGSLRF